MQSQRNSILEYQIYVVNILGPKLSIQTFTVNIFWPKSYSQKVLPSIFWGHIPEPKMSPSTFCRQNFGLQILKLFLEMLTHPKKYENDDDNDRSIRGREVQLIRSLMTGHTG